MWQERSYAGPRFGSYVSRAPATWWLIGITVGVHFAKAIIGAKNDAWEKAILLFGATTPAGWQSLELWRPFTSMLLHGGTSHILWNMLFLGFAGTMLEPVIGSRKLLGIYIISGLVASTSPLFNGNPYGSIGASGAINGVLVALAILMPDVMVLLMFLIPMKIKWVVAIFLGMDALNVLSANKEDPYKDSIGHLLGAAAGFSIAFLGPRIVAPWWSRYRAARVREREQERQEQNVDEERELDRLLEKISREGMPSLTESERRFLKRVSGKYQNSRRD